MIRHILKLAWQRKRASGLVIVEMSLAFLVIFFVVTLAAYFADNYRRPLGFEYENVWAMTMDMKQHGDDLLTPEMVERVERIIEALSDLGTYGAIAGAMDYPYSLNQRGQNYKYAGRDIESAYTEVTDAYLEVLSLQLVHGRWFEKSDDAEAWIPVVINERLQRELFAGEDPLGKVIGRRGPKDSVEKRVVGVISDFRKDGELAAPENFALERTKLGDLTHRPPHALVFRHEPKPNADFERTILKTVHSVAPGWSFELSPLTTHRRFGLRMRMAPLVGAALVAGLFMLMVALGMAGVLWQNVSQRTREIGLRRATGATASMIRTQIMGELFMISTAGVAMGTVLIVQARLLGIAGGVPDEVLAAAFVVSALFMYVLALAAGIYPSELASRIQPIAALRDE